MTPPEREVPSLDLYWGIAQTEIPIDVAELRRTIGLIADNWESADDVNFLLAARLVNGCPVGYAWGYPLPRHSTLFIYELGVAEHHRSAGIGGQIVAAAAALARAIGLGAVEATPSPRGDVARRLHFFSRNGFSPDDDGIWRRPLRIG